ncbi:MAG: 1,2-dihydroxy-3-keto-5-methylthiopentene dioxygenase [Sarea resinae]|nr:MAG: 1,2-dihydroxy-3-keto-5-methylthiopentene dioxygenase [Sarea resinae]
MKTYWYDNLPVNLPLAFVSPTRNAPGSMEFILWPGDGDQRLDHDSGRPVSVEHLASLGIHYYSFSSIDAVNALAAERKYKNRDEIIVSPDKMGEVYEEKVKSFFSEHLHEDEEIRYILDGEGFFDVRSEGDEWIRIRVQKDDLIIVPAGIYHRFTTDSQNYIHAMRLFQEDPKWTPLNRGPDVDENPFRKNYVQTTGTPSVPAH